MWRAPNRPAKEISLAFNDGLVFIHEVNDVAEPGCRPIENLSSLVKLPYASKKLGIERYFKGKQNQVEYERVITVPDPSPAFKLHNQQVAIKEDGVKYRINIVQNSKQTYPPTLDITLSRITQNDPEEVSD